MKDIILFLLLLVAAFFAWNVFIGGTAIDIQLHDTYFVFGKTEWVFLIVGLTTFFYFLAKGINRKFSDPWVNVGLLVGLCAVLVMLVVLLLMLMSVSGGVATTVISVFILIWISAIVWLAVKTARLWRNAT